MIESLFKDKKPNPGKLLAFGFEKKEEEYTYSAPLAVRHFEIMVRIAGNGKIEADVIDRSFGEKYHLHLVEGSGNPFAGMVRTEYEKILSSIAESCFDNDIFKSGQARAAIRYIKEKYGREPEYLWPKFPTNAIVRRGDNAKWFAALLVLSKNKLDIKKEGTADVLNLRTDPREIETITDGERYFPGYHMNKKHWISVCLDGSVPQEEIFRRIDASYDLAAGK